MDWTKVTTKHFLFTTYTQKEKGDLVTLMCLTAQIERMPERDEMVKVVHYKSLTHLQQTLNRRSIDLQDILNKVLEDVSKVENKRAVSRDTSKRYNEKKKSVDVSIDTIEKRREDNIISITSKDFEPLWNKYPKKDGRKQSLKHFMASVKTKDDLLKINTALDNYIKHLKIQKTETKYIKNGSTWFNNWEDWINYEAPLGNKPVVRVNETLDNHKHWNKEERYVPGKAGKLIKDTAKNMGEK